MAETAVKIPHMSHVPRALLAGEASEIPAAGRANTIWQKAITRKTMECTSATSARLRLVRMENSSILSSL
jgi:hypothetical protein